MEITVELVKELIEEQFPQYKNLEVRPVEKSGHDNRTFHLGNEMTVRLPSAQGYVAQVQKENQWLPYLQEHLDYPISKPIAVGKPNVHYPYPWSINQWIEGETLFEDTTLDKKQLAKELNLALRKLQTIDCTDGPKGALHNYYRGCDPVVYDAQTKEALVKLKDRLPTDILGRLWQKCVDAKYKGKDVWVHGDVAPGNILVQNHQFYGLIDFGVLGTGDPACDYAMAWTYFDKESKDIFLDGLDEGMIDRARGWALWKALITYDDTNIDFRENARKTIQVILDEVQ